MSRKKKLKYGERKAMERLAETRKLIAVAEALPTGVFVTAKEALALAESLEK